MRTENQQRAFDRHGGRCVICHRPATQVHEIEARSRRPDDWDDEWNEVPLCKGCHFTVHGDSRYWVDRLKEVIIAYREGQEAIRQVVEEEEEAGQGAG